MSNEGISQQAQASSQTSTHDYQCNDGDSHLQEKHTDNNGTDSGRQDRARGTDDNGDRPQDHSHQDAAVPGSSPSSTQSTAEGIRNRTGTRWTESEVSLVLSSSQKHKSGVDNLSQNSWLMHVRMGQMGYNEIGRLLGRTSLSCRLHHHNLSRKMGLARARDSFHRRHSSPGLHDGRGSFHYYPHPPMYRARHSGPPTRTNRPLIPLLRTQDAARLDGQPASRPAPTAPVMDRDFTFGHQGTSRSGQVPSLMHDDDSVSPTDQRSFGQQNSDHHAHPDHRIREAMNEASRTYWSDIAERAGVSEATAQRYYQDEIDAQQQSSSRDGAQRESWTPRHSTAGLIERHDVSRSYYPQPVEQHGAPSYNVQPSRPLSRANAIHLPPPPDFDTAQREGPQGFALRMQDQRRSEHQSLPFTYSDVRGDHAMPLRMRPAPEPSPPQSTHEASFALPRFSHAVESYERAGRPPMMESRPAQVAQSTEGPVSHQQPQSSNEKSDGRRDTRISINSICNSPKTSQQN